MAATAGLQTLKQAISEWKEDKSQAIGDLIGGVLIEVVAYQSAVQGLPACEAIVKDAAFPEFAMQPPITTKPEVFGVFKDDLQVNGYSIIYMIEQAMAAFNTGDLETFGKKMGQIMKLAHLPAANTVEKFTLKASRPATDMTNLAEILQGFFNGIGVEVGDFMDVLVCVYEADQSALELYADIQLWAEAW